MIKMTLNMCFLRRARNFMKQMLQWHANKFIEHDVNEIDKTKFLLWTRKDL
jgi:hypothetical protein